MPEVKRNSKNNQRLSMPRLQVRRSQLPTSRGYEMSNGWVLFAYIVVYGFMIGYATFLIMRLRSVRGRVEG